MPALQSPELFPIPSYQKEKMDAGLPEALDFDLDEVTRDDLGDRNLWILNDYLLANSLISTNDASNQILEYLPATTKGQADFGWGLSTDIMHVAKCIPPKHLSMSRLLDLVLMVYTSEKWLEDVQIDHWERLGWACRGSLNDVQTALEKDEREERNSSDPNDIAPDLEYRNYHAFNAYLKNLAGWSKDTPDSWALFELSRAHETDEQDSEGLAAGFPLCDAHALAAAQWILIDGENIHQMVLETHEDIAKVDHRGKRWTARAEESSSAGISPAHLCQIRWKFWQERFAGLASGARDGEFEYAPVTKESAREAAEYMQRLDDQAH